MQYALLKTKRGKDCLHSKLGEYLTTSSDINKIYGARMVAIISCYMNCGCESEVVEKQ
jgi:hypothetical protein